MMVANCFCFCFSPYVIINWFYNLDPSDSNWTQFTKCDKQEDWKSGKCLLRIIFFEINNIKPEISQQFVFPLFFILLFADPKFSDLLPLFVLYLSTFSYYILKLVFLWTKNKSPSLWVTSIWKVPSPHVVSVVWLKHQI